MRNLKRELIVREGFVAMYNENAVLVSAIDAIDCEDEDRAVCYVKVDMDLFVTMTNKLRSEFEERYGDDMDIDDVSGYYITVEYVGDNDTKITNDNLIEFDVEIFD
jgi:hypothetical protein